MQQPDMIHPFEIAKSAVDWAAAAVVLGMAAKIVPVIAGLFTIAWHIYRFSEIRKAKRAKREINPFDL